MLGYTRPNPRYVPLRLGLAGETCSNLLAQKPAHNPKVEGSNPSPATKKIKGLRRETYPLFSSGGAKVGRFQTVGVLKGIPASQGRGFNSRRLHQFTLSQVRAGSSGPFLFRCLAPRNQPLGSPPRKTLHQRTRTKTRILLEVAR
jgi:hypothetical protein